MSETTICDKELESIAKSMIEKYPNGHLTQIEVGWPCRSGIRAVCFSLQKYLLYQIVL